MLLKKPSIYDVQVYLLQLKMCMTTVLKNKQSNNLQAYFLETSNLFKFLIPLVQSQAPHGS